MNRPALLALLLAGCGPSLSRPQTVQVRIALTPPVAVIAPPPTVIEPVYLDPIVQTPIPPPVRTPEHVYFGQQVAPPTRLPLAVSCSPPARVLAGQPVTVTASANRAETTIHWRVLLAPRPAVYRFAPQFDPQDTNAQAGIGATVPFVTPIVGSYTLEAIAQEPDGESVTCETPVQVVGHGLRVELSWNTDQTDVDLHSVTSADPRWVSPADCYYANRRPDQGQLPDTQQRWLDTDDVNGEGPENIRVDQPFVDRAYLFGVHYYSSHGHPDPTRAIVVVYCGEQQVARFERDLVGGRSVPDNDFWQVASVMWQPNGTCSVRPINLMTRQGDVAGR